MAGYYEITVPPTFPSSYDLVTRTNKTNKEVLRSKKQLVTYLEACLALARSGGAYRAQSAREAERRAALESDNDDDDDAPAAAEEPAEAGAAPVADEEEEDEDETEDAELAAIERRRAAEAEALTAGERALAAATEEEIRLKAPYPVGAQVEARFRGGDAFYPAVVVALVVDAYGAYFVDLQYSDGSSDRENAVPVALVRPLQRRRRGSAEPLSKAKRRQPEEEEEEPAAALAKPDAVRVLHKFSGYGDFEGSVVALEADGARSVTWDADGATTTLTHKQFERAQRRYAGRHGGAVLSETSGRPKKGRELDTRAPPAPARGRGAPTPARTPASQLNRSPRADRKRSGRWAAAEEASLRNLVGELGEAWESVAARLGTGRSASAAEQKWQALGRARSPERAPPAVEDSTPAPPTRAPPPEATPSLVPRDAPTPPERPKPAKRARPAPGAAPTAARPYPPGTQVEARFRGGDRFYPALVVAARDGAVDVKYCDGSNDAETGVPLDLVRPLQRRKRTAAAAPPAPPPPAKKPAKKPATKKTKKAKAPPPISGWEKNTTWRPRAEAGTRNALYHGCGKCQWRPSGCRGCIAADAERGPMPAPPPLLRGAVTVAADEFLGPLLSTAKPDDDRKACWAAQRRTLEASVIITSSGVVDQNGFGVVARKPLRADTIIVDPTVLIVPRPSDYARAHLPPYDYIAFGANDYALLREVALAHCSATFNLNGADYAGSRHAPNVKWIISRHARGGAQLAWKLLADVAVGEELLATYTAPEFAAV